MLLEHVTLIVPFYRQQQMLARQLEVWNEYDDDVLNRFSFIIVDDGSPETALDLVTGCATPRVGARLSVFRIQVDIPWNRSGARNLGTRVAETEWVLHVDTDHVLPPGAARALLCTDCDPLSWYRFQRYRVGRADETRRKDAIADEAEFGAIKPHIDSYLCTSELYWKAGGYNEDFSGCLGGGSPFLAELAKVGGEPKLLSACLHVYTRHAIPDSSVFTLSRDTSEYTRRKKELLNSGKLKGHTHLRFPWAQVL